MNQTPRLIRGLQLALPASAAAFAVLIATAATAPAQPSTILTKPVGSGSAPTPSNSAADRKRELDRQLTALRENLEGTAKSLVDAAVNLRRAQSDLVDANAKVVTARSALATAQARDDVLAGRLAVAEAAVDKARRDLDTRRQQETDTRNRLGSIAWDTYVSSGLSGLSIALDAESPGQFADRVNVAGTALREQNSAIARLEVQQADTRARQARLGAATDAVAGLKDQSAILVQQRRSAERKASAASAVVAKLVALKQRSLKIIAARKSAEKKRVAALQKQADKLSATLKKLARDRKRATHGHAETHISSNGSGRLSYPVSAPVTSGFGRRFHPILHIWRLHDGTDFGAPCGTPVRAAAPGRIVRAGWAGGYGNQVVIDNGMMRGKDVATSYNHLSRYVKRSGTVRRGQVIAYSGTTGLSTGCHLHFGVYVNGVPTNPMNWL